MKKKIYIPLITSQKLIFCLNKINIEEEAEEVRER